MRPHGRARVSTSRPEAWATCDRCGFNGNRVDLRPQMQWAGLTLINKQILVCDRCYDVPSEHLRTIVLPPDPLPVHNPRPEPYLLDEADYRVTEESERRITEESDPRIIDDGT